MVAKHNEGDEVAEYSEEDERQGQPDLGHVA